MANIEELWFASAKQGRDDDLKDIISQKKVEVNKVDHLGNTALHYSAGAGHLECVKALISAKAFVNAKDKVGDTPLHKAAWRGTAEVVTALVNAGADIKIKNNQNQTPKDVAKNAQIAELLEPVQKRLWEDDEDEAPKKEEEWELDDDD